MGTLGDMKARIADETKRPNLTSQIALAITTAIQFYAPQRFWFNEASGTKALTDGATDYPVPTDFLSLIDGAITDSAGYRLPIGEPWPWDRYLANTTQATTAEGRPTSLTFFNSRLWPWPIPDADYTAELFYVGELTAFADDNSSNAWTTEAEPLIRARAKAGLYREVIRDYAEAAEQEAVERAWLAHLKRRTRGYGRPRQTVPTQW